MKYFYVTFVSYSFDKNSFEFLFIFNDIPFFIPNNIIFYDQLNELKC